jgi:hypothetical protein
MRFAMAAMCALATLAMGCSGGDTGGQARNADGLEAAATRFVTALWETDEYRDAYDVLREQCHEELSYTDFASEMRLAKAFFAGFMGIEEDEFEVGDVQVRDVTESAGEVNYTLKAGDDLDFGDDGEWEPWIFEDGAWRPEGCGDDDIDDGDGEEEPTRTGTLIPLDEAENQKARDNAIAFGEFAEFDDGLRATVLDWREIDRDDASEDNWVLVEVRIENTGNDTVDAPTFELLCSSAAEGFFYFNADSDRDVLEVDELLPGTFFEGDALFGYPDECTEPRVEASMFFSFDDEEPGIWFLE